MGLRLVRFLEVHDVHFLAHGRAEDADQVHGRAGREGGAYADHAGRAVGVAQGHVPGEHPTPIVSADYRLLDIEVIHQTNEVIGQMVDVVGADLGWAGGQAVAALVRRDGSPPLFGEGAKLTTPAEGDVRIAVAEQHWHARAAGIVIAHADFAEVSEARLRHSGETLAHFALLVRRGRRILSKLGWPVWQVTPPSITRAAPVM